MWATVSCRPYERGLPDSGFVAIDVTETRSLWRGQRYEGRLIVERRAKGRRRGHVPPVVAEARGKSIEDVVRQLLPTAQCNPEIGAALLRNGSA